MQLFQLIFGALLVIASFVTLFIFVKRTPNNLRGFYGAMFAIFAFILAAAGVTFIAIGAIQLA